MEEKSWYLSKEVWAAIISSVAGLLQKYFDMEVVSPELQAQLTIIIIILLRIFFTDSATNLNLKKMRKTDE